MFLLFNITAESTTAVVGVTATHIWPLFIDSTFARISVEVSATEQPHSVIASALWNDHVRDCFTIMYVRLVGYQILERFRQREQFAAATVTIHQNILACNTSPTHVLMTDTPEYDYPHIGAPLHKVSTMVTNKSYPVSVFNDSRIVTLHQNILACNTSPADTFSVIGFPKYSSNIHGSNPSPGRNMTTSDSVSKRFFGR